MRNCHLTLLMSLLSIAASRAEERDTVQLEFIAPDNDAKNIAIVKGPAGEPAIQVTGAFEGSTTTIALHDNPPVTSHHYIVRGQVKYEGVAQDGYLELLNDFGPQGVYFTRSLAPWGAMGKLSGKSDWRSFELPFYANPGMRPKRLTLNVVLPGAGIVTVSQPMLISRAADAAWWTGPQAGLVGGGLGVLLGTLGALIGICSSWGKARQFTLALYVVGLTLSGVAMIAGGVAVSLRQPWHVCYPLVLTGIIGLTVLGANLWMLLQRSRADELRRIAAVDA